MKIVRFDEQGCCQFIYFDWREFKFKTSCWARNFDSLLGKTKNKNHFFIGLFNPRKEE